MQFVPLHRAGKCQLGNGRNGHVKRLLMFFSGCILIGVLPALGQGNTNISRMQEIAGTYEGSSSEPIQSYLQGAFVDCTRIVTSVSYDLTLRVDRTTGKGTGRMVIESELEAKYAAPMPNSQEQANCFRAAVGDPDSSTGDSTTTYDVTWEVKRYNSRKIELEMRAVDCSGTLCGRLTTLFRDASVYDSGDILYERPNGRPIRLSAR